MINAITIENQLTVSSITTDAFDAFDFCNFYGPGFVSLLTFLAPLTRLWSFLLDELIGFLWSKCIITGNYAQEAVTGIVRSDAGGDLTVGPPQIIETVICANWPGTGECLPEYSKLHGS
jgi:hypothetical protein